MSCSSKTTLLPGFSMVAKSRLWNCRTTNAPPPAYWMSLFSVTLLQPRAFAKSVSDTPSWSQSRTELGNFANAFAGFERNGHHVYSARILFPSLCFLTRLLNISNRRSTSSLPIAWVVLPSVAEERSLMLSTLSRFRVYWPSVTYWGYPQNSYYL